MAPRKSEPISMGDSPIMHQLRIGTSVLKSSELNLKQMYLPRIEDHVMIGVTDVDTLKEHSGQ